MERIEISSIAVHRALPNRFPEGTFKEVGTFTSFIDVESNRDCGRTPPKRAHESTGMNARPAADFGTLFADADSPPPLVQIRDEQELC
jgi:hypothetical protein